MIQRNITGDTLVFPTLNPPAEVPDGGVLDHPVLLAGFEVVDTEVAAQVSPPEVVDVSAPASGVTAPVSVLEPVGGTTYIS